MEQLTDKQQIVYDYLQIKNTARSAYDILDDLREQGFRAPSQIYRVLKKLLDLGLIHRVESLNAFIACAQMHEVGRSAMTICDSCGAVEEISIPGFAGDIEEFGSKLGFTPREIVVELKGRCSVCN